MFFPLVHVPAVRFAPRENSLIDRGQGISKSGTMMMTRPSEKRANERQTNSLRTRQPFERRNDHQRKNETDATKVRFLIEVRDKPTSAV